MVWSQYVYEATSGFDPVVSDDDEFNDEHTPLNIEDWEVEYSDELRYMWNTMNTLLYDARLEHTIYGKISGGLSTITVSTRR